MKVTRLIASTAVLAVLFLLVTHTTAAAQQTASAVQRAPPSGVPRLAHNLRGVIAKCHE